MSRTPALVALVLLLLNHPAVAQNLFTNPGFASNLNGWFVDNSNLSTYSAVWNSLDASGSPSSGSVRITNQYPDAAVTSGPILQCVPVVGDAEYSVSTQYYLPAGQSRSGSGQSLLAWYTSSNCTTGPSFGGEFSVTTFGIWQTAGGTVTAPSGAHSARLQLSVHKVEAGGTLQAHADNAHFQLTSTSTCAPSASILCIDKVPGDRRFRTSVTYETVQSGGLSGSAHAVDLDTLGIHQGGIFWFFDAGNPELLIKVLDGCGINGKYWVFFSAGTNVGFTVEVLDTVTGEVFRRINPDLTPAPPEQSTDALPCT